MNKDNISACALKAADNDSVDTAKRQMPSEKEIDRLSELFKIIGNNTRIKILWALEYAELCVCDICSVLNMTKSAVSHQLRLLKDCDMIKCRKQGKHIYYSINDSHVRSIIDAAYIHQKHTGKKT